MSKYRVKTEQVTYDTAFTPNFGGGNEDLVYKDKIRISPGLDMYELTGSYAGKYLVPTPALDGLFDENTLIWAFLSVVVTKIFESTIRVSADASAVNTYRTSDPDYKSGVLIGGNTTLNAVEIDESQRLKINQDFYLCSQDYFDKQVADGNVSSTPSAQTLVEVEFHDKIMWYK